MICNYVVVIFYFIDLFHITTQTIHNFLLGSMALSLIERGNVILYIKKSVLNSENLNTTLQCD